MSKATKIILAILLAAALIAGGVAGYDWWYRENHVFVEDAVYARDSVSLDLRGTGISVAHYEALRQQLPDCQIRWDIPFQEGYLADDATEVTLTTLSQEDVERLDYLPGLKKVNALACKDYDMLMELARRHPDCDIAYIVTISGEDHRENTTGLTFQETQADAEELMQKLSYLPDMETVHFVEPEVAAEDLAALRQQYPDIDFSWEKTVFDVTYADDITELDFSNIPMEGVDAVETIIPYFPDLETVDMSYCGIDNETMASFRDRVREHCKVVWSVRVGTGYIRTDDIYFMPVKYGIKVNNYTIGNLKYCEDMLCVDLGHKEVWDISWVEYMPHLKYLIVGDGPIQDISPISCCKELVYLELFSTPVRDLTPLLGCTALEDLNVSDTAVDLTPLAEMTWLKNLWIGNRGVSREVRTLLTESLPDTTIAFDCSITGNGWRLLQNYYDMRDLLGMPYNAW